VSAVLDSLPEWLRWVVILAGLAGGAIVMIAAGIAALALVAMAAEAGQRGAKRLTLWLATAMMFVVVGTLQLIGAGCRAAARAVCAALLAQVQRLRRWLELRRAWKTEFRDEFETFADFREAFENGGKPRLKTKPRPEERREPHFGDAPPKREPPSPPPDPRKVAYSAACKLLGLPESGFTLPQLKERHRALIQRLHPDMGGSHQKAAAINAARDLIKATKGWTS
jgi:hypothetical protein